MTTEPMACRWCDVPKRRHVNLWKPPVGYHRWERPEPWQVKARMERRRVRSGRPLPAKWTPPVPTRSTVCDHTGPYTVDQDAEGWPILHHPCGCVEGYERVYASSTTGPRDMQHDPCDLPTPEWRPGVRDDA